MNENKRIFWLDFIKVIAMLAVITVHFNVQISQSFVLPNKIFPNMILNGVYLGSFGVILFFIASGVGCQISYEKKNYSVGKYYYERFKAIYPMFWMAWLIACCINLLLDKSLPSASIRYLTFTIFGMDGWLHVLINLPFNFYILGEWFLGCIILMYLFAPFIHKGIEKFPVLTMVLSVIIALLCKLPMMPDFFSSDVWILRRMPEFVFGMLLVKKVKKFNWHVSVVGGLICVITMLMKNFIPVFEYSVLVVGGVFLVLSGISDYITSVKFRIIISKISKYSYAVFLVHHFIAFTLMKFLDSTTFRAREIVVLYIIYLTLTFGAATGIYKLTNKLMNFGRWLISSKDEMK